MERFGYDLVGRKGEELEDEGELETKADEEGVGRTLNWKCMQFQMHYPLSLSSNDIMQFQRYFPR